MEAKEQESQEKANKPQGREKTSKKSQILSLYLNGMTALQELASVTDSQVSYVASVLQEEGFLSGYFDLYTHSTHPMNVYSQFFSGKLGFKSEAVAQEGVRILEDFYRLFQEDKDRAGQHHALTVALTMFDRARWCGKIKEAEHYKHWLILKLEEPDGSPREKH